MKVGESRSETIKWTNCTDKIAGFEKRGNSTIESILLRENIVATEYGGMKQDMIQVKCEAY